jgi:hypothetical protein
MRTEVAALNAGLLPEADDFLAETPRPLGPLKFYEVDPANEPSVKYQTRRATELHEMRNNYYAGDVAFQNAEARTFLTNLFAQLTALLGYRWGFLETERATHPGYVHLDFKRYQDTVRIREIIALLRELSSRARFPWQFNIMVEPHGDMDYEMEQLQELEAKANEPEAYWLARYFKPETVLQENQEEEKRRRERYELLEREHLHNLQQQGQEEPLEDLSLLAAAGEEEADEDADEAADTEDEEMEELLGAANSDDDEDDGGVALAPPPPAPPGTEDLSDRLSYAITLFEDCMIVGCRWTENARYGLGENPVPWTPEA